MTPGSAGWGVEPDDAILYDGASGQTRTIKNTPGDQRCYYVTLREALHGTGPNPVTPEQASTVMAIMEAAAQSDREGRRISPELTASERAAWKRP